MVVTSNILTPRVCVRRGSSDRGFTLMELLVVIAIIVLLIAIIIPSMKYLRDSARKTSTLHTLSMIDTGLQSYFADFGIYPPSKPEPSFGYSSPVSLNRGSLMLSEGLAGYLDYANDGAGPSNPSSADPLMGFRPNHTPNGKVYGPYVSITTKTWKKKSNSEQMLVDGNGNEILYYRSTQGGAASLRPNATLVFGDGTNSLFVVSHNTAVTNGDGSSSADPLTITSVKFWNKIGTTNNTLSTGLVPSRDTFLLLSSGQDGIYFTDDDVVSSR